MDVEATTHQVRRRRLRKDPVPRFKPDVSEQLDVVWGCPAAVVPADHMARQVKRMLCEFDVSALVACYSSQGRRGFHPRHMLGALVYASIIGLHESTKISATMRTDHALRFVGGGHVISAGRLRAFKRENAEFFEKALIRTLEIARERQLLKLDQLATDSVRLRADASENAVATRKRSEKRLAELARIDILCLDGEARAEHEAKVAKHLEVIRLCQEQARTSIVRTSPDAALMKFPNGASAPGHRATVVACGVKERLIIDVLVDSAATDFGKLGPAVIRARANLHKAGVPLDAPMQVAGDAGYFSSADLAFADANRSLVDVLIAEAKPPQRTSEDGTPIFTVDAFKRASDGMHCPAGTLMTGPQKDGDRERWEGRGCQTCGLRQMCTRGEKRTLTIDTEFIRLRNQMRDRLAQPGGKERYNQRIATVEPVFSYLESEMGFRRVTSRKGESVRAEVLLKVLAYNIVRLITAKRLRHVLMTLDLSSPIAPLEAA